MGEALLNISGVHTFYGHIEALKGVDVEVKPGEIVTMIGANGAGKSTLLMTICGTPQARHGQVFFEGRDITRRQEHPVADFRGGRWPLPAHGRAGGIAHAVVCGQAQLPGRRPTADP